MTIRNNSTTYSIAGSLAVHVVFTLGAGSFLMNINNSVQPQKTYNLEFVKRKTPPLVKKEMIRKEQVRKEIKVASLTPKAMPILQPKKAIRQTRKARAIVKTAISTPKQVQKVTLTKSVMVRNTPTINRKVNTSVPRSFTTPSSKRSTRVVMVQGAQHFKLSKLPKRVIRSSSSVSSSKRSTRVVMVQGAQHFKLSKLPKRVIRSSSSVSSSKRSTRVVMVQGAQHFKLSKLPKRVVRSSSSSSFKSDNGRVKMVQTGVKLASLTSFSSPRGVPNIVDTGALKNYIGQVQRSVERAKNYPEASRRAGRQGKVRVQFTILRSGEVDNVRLLTETPYVLLNQAAMAAVKEAALPGFPDSIMKQSLKVILPFRFELN